MNWKRGLLRLWAVLALLWVVATTWLLWDEATFAKPKFLMTSSLNTKYSIEGPPGATKQQALEHFYKAIAKLAPGPDAGSVNVRSPDDVAHEFPAATSVEVISRTQKQYWQSKLVEFRKKYPEYNDMSDADLADALYRKFYSDMPREQFNAKIGLMDERITVTDESVPDWSRRRMALAAILLPPLGVLIIGAALFWAGQGFLTRTV